MVLVDTSVWVEHFRSGVGHLSELLLDGRVVTHLVVIGELSCSGLCNRSEILLLMESIPRMRGVNRHELGYFIEQAALAGVGLGLLDAELLACVKLDGAELWSWDRRLHDCASDLGMAHRPS